MSEQVTPLFKDGKVPAVPHCEIQGMERRSDGLWYFIRNNYNPWASGWMSEDRIVHEVTKAQRAAKGATV
jgi:hypothetical protein